METYKKPVVASKSEPSSSSIMPIMVAPVIVKKLLGDDDFHVEKALTPRKNFSE